MEKQFNSLNSESWPKIHKGKLKYMKNHKTVKTY